MICEKPNHAALILDMHVLLRIEFFTFTYYLTHLNAHNLVLFRAIVLDFGPETVKGSSRRLLWQVLRVRSL